MMDSDSETDVKGDGMHSIYMQMMLGSSGPEKVVTAWMFANLLDDAVSGRKDEIATYHHIARLIGEMRELSDGQ